MTILTSMQSCASTTARVSTYSIRKPMRLIRDSNGRMECRFCGSAHYASLKSGGGFRYGCWQCCDRNCPSKALQQKHGLRK